MSAQLLLWSSLYLSFSLSLPLALHFLLLLSLLCNSFVLSGPSFIICFFVHKIINDELDQRKPDKVSKHTSSQGNSFTSSFSPFLSLIHMHSLLFTRYLFWVFFKNTHTHRLCLSLFLFFIYKLETMPSLSLYLYLSLSSTNPHSLSLSLSLSSSTRTQSPILINTHTFSLSLSLSLSLLSSLVTKGLFKIFCKLWNSN